MPRRPSPAAVQDPRAPSAQEPPAHEPPAQEPPAHEPPAHEPAAQEPSAHEPAARRAGRSALRAGTTALPAGPSTLAGSSAVPAAPSALATALDRVGDRWSLLLVEALLPGSRRFNELSEAVPGIAPNILSDRLRRLERTGILVATPYSRRPVRMEYALTRDGRELAGALRLLADWGARRGGEGEPLRHDLCGTPLEAQWHCPTCGTAVGEETAIDELTRF